MKTEQLEQGIEIFESKMKRLQEEYKAKHGNNIEKSKMERYVNRKMQKEIRGMIFMNVMLPAQAIGILPNI